MARRGQGLLGRGALVVLLCAFAGSVAGASHAAGAEICPVKAVFVPSELATKYTGSVLGTTPSDVSYKWTVALALVDPAGAPAPGVPGTGAAVDPGCDNAHLPGGAAGAPETFSWPNQTDSFTWFHGDKGSYSDGYGCNH